MSPPQQQWPRGPLNQLHAAAYDGSTERTIVLLSSGLINIDQGDPDGATPLMYAAVKGFSPIARILLSKGANVSIANDDGRTALHMSAQYGHLAVTVDLIEAGANLETRSSKGITPLHLAARYGHSEVTTNLMEAGANVDNHCGDETNPLLAAREGHLGVVKELLRAGANPLLAATSTMDSTEMNLLPLDMAAIFGHSCVVRELIKQRGIEGCAGPDGGAQALQLAALYERVDTMAVLMDAGVIDTGVALIAAAGQGSEAAVKLLFQQRQLERFPIGLVEYVNSYDEFGYTPLFRSIATEADVLCSPRVAQLLVDAGADATKAVRVEHSDAMFTSTPLAFANKCLREKKATEEGECATEEQLGRMEAVRRLLLRVEAVRAVSWLWHTDAPDAQPVERDGTSNAVTASTPLRVMLPILRRRARRQGLVMVPLFRHSMKIGHETASDDGDGGVALAAV